MNGVTPISGRTRAAPALLLAGVLLSPAALRATADFTVYGDALGSGCQYWGWAAVQDFAYTTQKHAGTSSIYWEPWNWDGLILHSDASFDVADYLQLRFWVRGESPGGQLVDVFLQSGDTTKLQVDLEDHVDGGQVASGAWKEVVIDFAAAGFASGSFNQITFQAGSALHQPGIEIDDIVIVGNTAPPAPVTVSVDPALDRRAISRWIYGVNFADPAQIDANGYTVNRWGGNATSRYNYLLDTYNSAFDWFFLGYAYGDGSSLPDDSEVNGFLDDTFASGAAPIVTVPTIGWVAGPDRDRTWGFSETLYGPQLSDECRYFGPNPGDWPAWCNPDAGNGLCNPAVNTTGFCSAGGRIVGNDPQDTSVSSGSVFVGNWVEHLTTRFGAAGSGGVPIYSLDNEAMLWNSTHPDVHPQPATYDEVWENGRDAAHAIKAEDPTALVTGPVTWGWCDLFTSAADAAGDCTAGPDRTAHGGTPFVEWYLQQICDEEAASGVRVVDLLDVHYYPQAAGVAGTDNAVDETAAAVRLRSLRELWDPTYVSESWINDEPNLIPRLQAWIAARCPGVEIALTEYKWGADDSPTGALAQAELLAILAREGVALATRWVAPEAGTQTEQAFRLYRNYDGGGAKVTGESVRATTSDVDGVGAYAVLGGDERLFVLLFNKDVDPRDVTVDVNAALTGTVALWRFTGATALGSAGTLPVAGDGFAATLPARSATLAVVRLDTPGLFRDDFESRGLDAWSATAP